MNFSESAGLHRWSRYLPVVVAEVVVAAAAAAVAMLV